MLCVRPNGIGLCHACCCVCAMWFRCVTYVQCIVYLYVYVSLILTSSASLPPRRRAVYIISGRPSQWHSPLLSITTTDSSTKGKYRYANLNSLTFALPVWIIMLLTRLLLSKIDAKFRVRALYIFVLTTCAPILIIQELSLWLLGNLRSLMSKEKATSFWCYHRGYSLGKQLFRWHNPSYYRLSSHNV